MDSLQALRICTAVQAVSYVEGGIVDVALCQDQPRAWLSADQQCVGPTLGWFSSQEHRLRGLDHGIKRMQKVKARWMDGWPSPVRLLAVVGCEIFLQKRWMEKGYGNAA